MTTPRPDGITQEPEATFRLGWLRGSVRAYLDAVEHHSPSAGWLLERLRIDVEELEADLEARRAAARA